MLLNSTTTPYQAGSTSGGDTRPPPPPNPAEQFKKGVGPTLKSIFTAGPIGAQKPAFGEFFAGLVDLHLLCTRVLRSKGGGNVWVVEVLLDKVGVYEFEEGGEVVTRRCREQRWTAVEVEGGSGRLVGAYK